MKKTKVIASKNLPMRPPLWTSLVAWLLLDRFQPPGWVWGAVGCLFAFAWIVYFCTLFVHESTELKELS